ncbi:MAG TPA: transcription antitermination factor NusB [Syntrophorhabdaceae bacterium]|nr:transcription antitermination factor NusB [Syntrophorhabdaceae bacterium]
MGEVEKGSFLDETIDTLFQKRRIDSKAKGIIYEITSGTIRWKGFFEWILEMFARRSIKPRLKYLLWITLYQISFMKKSPYHVIKEAVEFAKQKDGIYGANFVNAILRRYINEVLDVIKKNEPISSIDMLYQYIINNKPMPSEKSISIGYSFPEWMVIRWLKRYGEKETIRLCAHLNKTPFFTVRIEAVDKEREDIIRHFEKKGITFKSARFVNDAYYINKLAHVIDDPVFKRGLLFVQDEASQLAVIAVDPKRGDVILDACCGFGTKTAQIKWLAKETNIFSIDRDMKKLSKNRNKGNLIKGDVAARPFKEEIFDKILLDAPCSSVGIIRKHPEIKWRLNEKDIIRHGREQLAMIESLWPSLKKNGCFIYSVCSFEPEETLLLIEELKKKYKFVVEKPLPILFNNGYFISLPHETDLDGFFIARLKKQ